jgi:hypothetical protein
VAFSEHHPRCFALKGVVPDSAHVRRKWNLAWNFRNARDLFPKIPALESFLRLKDGYVRMTPAG